MSDVWIRSHDGTLLVPAREITALNVVGTALEARVASMGVVVLAEGPAEELADAAHSLMRGIDGLGEGDFTVTASRHRAGGIGVARDRRRRVRRGGLGCGVERDHRQGEVGRVVRAFHASRSARPGTRGRPSAFISRARARAAVTISRSLGAAPNSRLHHATSCGSRSDSATAPIQAFLRLRALAYPRNAAVVVTKRSGSSSHGKWPAPG